ncbi:MAG: leucyl aminopeptidase [Alphaproteobacteria bacterium]
MFQDLSLTSLAKEIDTASSGAVARAIKVAGFEGKQGQSCNVSAPAGTQLDALVLLGGGAKDDLSDVDLQTLGGSSFKAAETKSNELAIDASALTAAQAAQLGYGAALRSYTFTKYLTKQKDSAKINISSVSILTDDTKSAAALSGALEARASGVQLTRDLVSEPANILYPETLAERAKAELEPLGVEFEIFDHETMEEMGFGALIGVAQGSIRPARMVVMKWNGGKEGDQPISFIGKGVTFDTGGISIKPAAGMEDMKWDMGGSGVVVGLMKALAGRKANVNVVAAIGCVENMPGSNAQRPGDIVTSYSGQTIEVLNTDAEGRLVLADVLWYIQEQYKPKFMIDLATLTGAIIVALGYEHGAVFSNDDELAAQITAAGKTSGDTVWHMPIGEAYNKQLNSPAADVKNIGGGRWGGSITAACFLERFVNDTTWAHLDIAGVTWSGEDKPTSRKGATGWGVKLLDRLVSDHYEG